MTTPEEFKSFEPATKAPNYWHCDSCPKWTALGCTLHKAEHCTEFEKWTVYIRPALNSANLSLELMNERLEELEKRIRGLTDWAERHVENHGRSLLGGGKR